MKKNIHKEEQLLAQISNNPKYKGKQVVIIGDEIRVLSTKSKVTRARLLTSLVKKYPDKTPLITFVSKDSVFILVS